MARRHDAGTLRQLLAVRGAMRIKAEAGLTSAQRDVRDTALERRTAEDALMQAEADWRTGVATRVYPPDWLRALGARVVDRDRLVVEARGLAQKAEQALGRSEAALRHADASEQVAAGALARARSAEARRREERRLIDRPAKATVR